MCDIEYELKTELKQLITTGQAWQYKVLPVRSNNGTLDFYYSDTITEEEELANELLVLFGQEISLLPKPNAWVVKYLNKYYPKDHNNSPAKNISEYSISGHVNILDEMIEEAASIKSSDIHLEAYEESCRVRFRIDGKLVERYIINKYNYPSLINKIKVKANLDISEKRLPQDGRIIYSNDSWKFDIRVSILPTLYGEKIVMRLLNRDATQLDLEVLGFNENQHKSYLEGVKKPNGIILISGPTGSGKTTTLYATLKNLNKESINILTIEDPIEYTLEGINQVQLKEDIGLNFASAMRTFLRQDPDIIMLGEIRDTETAQMAVRASLTGHLVLSTIHTNSAWGTITRLVDMGVPPYMVASTLNLSVAQRLVRKLCPHCKESQKFNKELLPPGFKADRKISEYYVPVGCDQCYYTGYKGRQALYEIIPIDNQLKQYIREGIYEINEYLEHKKIFDLSYVAFDMLIKGVTSLEEVYPILSSSLT